MEKTKFEKDLDKSMERTKRLIFGTTALMVLMMVVCLAVSFHSLRQINGIAEKNDMSVIQAIAQSVGIAAGKVKKGYESGKRE